MFHGRWAHDDSKEMVAPDSIGAKKIVYPKVNSDKNQYKAFNLSIIYSVILGNYFNNEVYETVITDF